MIRFLSILALLLGVSGPALAWPYEVYRVPADLSGYRVSATATLNEGVAELLTDARITDANRDKVRTILLGGDAKDPKLQDSIDQDDPRWAIVRFTPKGGGKPEFVVLDHALASIEPADIDGSGKPKLKVSIDYIDIHRGVLTLFMEPRTDGLKPVEYTDVPGGYKVQIELMDADKAWWREGAPAGKAKTFLMVDSRFDAHTDLMSIRWDGTRWLRATKRLPGGAVPEQAKFPAPAQFP
jgi:hypothetical protein